MTLERQNEIIELIKKEVKPALGCTEPVAVALAVARSCEAVREAGGQATLLDVEVSANILKNGMGVGIPGTGMIGLHIASALGATCGKSYYKLEVLKDLSEDSINIAKQMVENKDVKISLADTPLKLYIEATAIDASKNIKATTIIKDNHDSIISVSLNGKTIEANSSNDDCLNDSKHIPIEKNTLDYKLTIKEILDFAKCAPIEKIDFILDSVKLNQALSLEGLLGDYGLNVGKTIACSVHKDLFGTSLLTHAMAATAAALDASIAGCTLPAMSN